MRFTFKQVNSSSPVDRLTVTAMQLTLRCGDWICPLSPPLTRFLVLFHFHQTRLPVSNGPNRAIYSENDDFVYDLWATLGMQDQPDTGDLVARKKESGKWKVSWNEEATSQSPQLFKIAGVPFPVRKHEGGSKQLKVAQPKVAVCPDPYASRFNRGRVKSFVHMAVDIASCGLAHVTAPL